LESQQYSGCSCVGTVRQSKREHHVADRPHPSQRDHCQDEGVHLECAIKISTDGCKECACAPTEYAGFAGRERKRAQPEVVEFGRREDHRQPLGEAQALCVLQLLHRNQDEVDECPYPASTEGEQFRDTKTGLAQIEAVYAERAQEK